MDDRHLSFATLDSQGLVDRSLTNKDKFLRLFNIMLGLNVKLSEQGFQSTGDVFEKTSHIKLATTPCSKSEANAKRKIVPRKSRPSTESSITPGSCSKMLDNNRSSDSEVDLANIGRPTVSVEDIAIREIEILARKEAYKKKKKGDNTEDEAEDVAKERVHLPQIVKVEVKFPGCISVKLSYIGIKFQRCMSIEFPGCRLRQKTCID